MTFKDSNIRFFLKPYFLEIFYCLKFVINQIAKKFIYFTNFPKQAFVHYCETKNIRIKNYH